ncbi:MAG: hypothetical protein E7641_02660 [Ruminococcaceae bacterium]|nr:hypothetical protein [Oscillospiraceae bacterium]
MNNEITLSFLWKIFVSNWKKILLITLAAVLIVGCVTAFLIEKKYSSKVTFYVINTNPDLEYTTTSYLAATEQLSNNYIQIIFSDVMLKPLAEELKAEYGYQYTVDQLRSMITSSIVAEASMFDIKVTNTDSKCAYNIAKSIEKLAPEVLQKVIKPWLFDDKIDSVDDLKKEDITECITAINEPREAKGHDSPSLIINLAVAAIGALVVSYAVFMLSAFFDTVVKSEEDIKQFVQKYPLIGTIPTWSED